MTTKKSRIFVVSIVVLILFTGLSIRHVHQSNSIKLDSGILVDNSTQDDASEARTRTTPRKNSAPKTFAGPQYTLFAGDGLPSPALLDLAGISPDRREDLKEVLDENAQRVGISMESRAVQISVGSSATPGEIAYSIPADANNSTALVSELESDLKTQFGEGAAKILIPYIVKPRYFGAYGAMDVTIKREWKVADGFGVWVNTLTVTDPATGELKSEGPVTRGKVYESYLGKILWDKFQKQ